MHWPLVFLLTTPWLQASQLEMSAPGAIDEQAMAPAATGLTAQLDPSTGRFRPMSSSQYQALVEPLRRKGAAEPELIPSPVPGGGMMIELDGRFSTPSVVSIDADGHLTSGCDVIADPIAPAMQAGHHDHGGH